MKPPFADTHDERPPSEHATMRDDDAIRALVKRLSRAHPSGGDVIERAAIMAAGGDATAVLAWVVAHSGEPEESAPRSEHRGLHSARLSDTDRAGSRAPRRYVFPPGALS